MNLLSLLLIFFIVLLTIYSVIKGVKAQKKEIIGGDTGILGKKGTCVKVYSTKKGKVYVNGELWDAQFDGEVKEGEEVIVVGIVENKPIVKKVEEI